MTSCQRSRDHHVTLIHVPSESLESCECLLSNWDDLVRRQNEAPLTWGPGTQLNAIRMGDTKYPERPVRRVPSGGVCNEWTRLRTAARRYLFDVTSGGQRQ